MLFGEYQHTIDGKGRVIMPVKFREALGDKFYITRGLDGSLLVFGDQEWQEFSQKVSALPFMSKDSRNFQRSMLGGAVECETDKQGRFLIPQGLRDYAEIEKNVIVMGNGNRIEIWDSEKYTKLISDLDNEAMSELMFANGISL